MKHADERRRAQRYSTRLSLIEQDTGEVLGYCDEISLSGVRLISETPLPDKQELRVWLGRTEDYTGIPLSLFRVWKAFSDSDPRSYYAGLHIIDINKETQEKLQELIDELFTTNQ